MSKPGDIIKMSAEVSGFVTRIKGIELEISEQELVPVPKVETVAPKTLKAFITPFDRSVSVVSNSHVLSQYDCLNVTGNQVCIEAGIYDDPDRVRTWNDMSDMNPLKRRISNHIPLCLFFGKKDGDTVDLLFKNKKDEIVTVTVTLRGILGGKFEKHVYNATVRFGGIYDYDPKDRNDVPEIVQYCMIVAAHQQYAESTGYRPELPKDFDFVKGWIKCLKKEIPTPIPNVSGLSSDSDDDSLFETTEGEIAEKTETFTLFD